jgi:hypothetical protein
VKPARDPVRLAELHSTDAQPELGAAIRALRAEQVSGARVEALATRLAPQLAAPTMAATGATALGTSGWAKWLVSSVLVIAAGVIVLSRLGGPSAERAQPSARAAQAPMARADEHAVAAPAAAALAPAPAAPALRPATAVKPAPARTKQAVPPAPTAPHAEAELALLQRSQAALDHAPAEALALAEQHAQAYPRGLFAQEREILALEALLKLKQKSAAIARAERFMRAYPVSPHARRVRALLERSHSLATPTITPSSLHSSGDPAPAIP